MSNYLTMAQLRDKTIARVWADQKTAKTSAYLSGRIVAALGPTKAVLCLTARDVDDFIEGLEARGNSNGTINRQLAVLSKMLHFAKTRDYIAAVPHIEFKRASKGRDRYLTVDEERAILEWLTVQGHHSVHDLVAFLLDTGARVGEALKLEWCDIANKRVTFRDTKNGTTRTIPLTLRARAILVRPEGEHDDVRPFALDYSHVRQVWDRVRQELSLPDVVLHSLRHTCASRLVQRGASIQYVKEWLGHKTLNMTMRYAHLAPESLDSLAALLERP